VLTLARNVTEMEVSGRPLESWNALQWWSRHACGLGFECVARGPVNEVANVSDKLLLRCWWWTNYACLVMLF